MKKFVCFVLIISSIAAVKNTVLNQRPVRYFHGLGDKCDPADTTCVETGAGISSYFDLKEQAKVGCEILKKQIFKKGTGVHDEWEHGFHMIGFSQGGLIARLVFEHCLEVQPLVRTLITIGTPNYGLDKLPTSAESPNDSYWEEFVRYLIKKAESSVKAELKERSYSFSQMLNIDENTKAVLIQDLITKSLAPYKNLETFMMIYFANDQIISPKNSQTFGVDWDESAQQFKPFPTSPIYEELRLSELYLNKRLWFCKANGQHLKLTSDDYTEMRKFYSDNCVVRAGLDHDRLSAAYRNCAHGLSSIYEFTSLKCENYGVKGQEKQAVTDAIVDHRTPVPKDVGIAEKIQSLSKKPLKFV